MTGLGVCVRLLERLLRKNGKDVRQKPGLLAPCGLLCRSTRSFQLLLQRLRQLEPRGVGRRARDLKERTVCSGVPESGALRVRRGSRPN